MEICGSNIEAVVKAVNLLASNGISVNVWGAETPVTVWMKPNAFDALPMKTVKTEVETDERQKKFTIKTKTSQNIEYKCLFMEKEKRNEQEQSLADAKD